MPVQYRLSKVSFILTSTINPMEETEPDQTVASTKGVVGKSVMGSPVGLKAEAWIVFIHQPNVGIKLKFARGQPVIIFQKIFC